MSTQMAKKISRIRAQNKLTQKQFAELCNISKSVLSQYEQGTRNPSNRALYRICNGLDLNPAVFGLPLHAILCTQATALESVDVVKKREQKRRRGQAYGEQATKSFTRRDRVIKTNECRTS